MMQNDLFEGLSWDELKKVYNCFVAMKFWKKDLIYTKSSAKSSSFELEPLKVWIYFVVSWVIKISVKNAFRNYTIAFVRDWDFFWEMSTILNFEPTADVFALTDVKINFLPSDIFNKLLLEIPQLAVNFSKHLAKTSQRLSANIFDHVFKSLESRVASSIMSLINEFWEDYWDNQKIIWIKVTHQDLSDFIWTNRETVTKILNQFKKQWLLSFVERKIVITDLKALDKLATV